MAGISLEPEAVTGNSIIPAKPGTVTVAGHPSVDIPPGTLNNILKQAGLR
jgi:predicted RNA binding protein YcfA (HicA-like mRNA interferase family)